MSFDPPFSPASPGTTAVAPAVAASATRSAREDAATRLVIHLGRALHAYGTPSHRLEQAMTRVSERLGLSGHFFSTPTAIFASFTRGERQDTVLVRAEPGEINLEKMARLERVYAGVLAGSLDIAAADAEVEAVLGAPRLYGGLRSTFALPLAGGTAAVFLGGGWREVLAAALTSLVLGVTARLLARRPNSGRLVELAAAVLAAAGSTTFAHLFARLAGLGQPVAFSSSVVLLASLIVFIPGLTLTVAMSELANRHLVAGSSRLAGALATFLILGFGVALGQRLATASLGPLVLAEPVPLPGWFFVPALLISAFGLLVLFQAPLSDFRWVLVGAAVAVVSGQVGSNLLGPELGAFVGAVCVGLVSNALGRLLDRPGAVIQMPGLLLLVPGSLGFRSVSALLAQDVLAGVQTAFTMVLVAVALVTGLLIANVLLPSRRVL